MTTTNRRLPADRRTRRAYRQAIRLLPVDGNLRDFVAAVSTYRGRPIYTIAEPWEPGKPTGTWIARPDADYLAYDLTSSAGRQAAVICHEISHMLLGHHGQSMDNLAAAVLHRDFFGGDIEAEAEALGTSLAAEALRRQTRARLDEDPISRRLR